jgi:DNA-binding LytR/AlgR family response regulator
MKLTDVEKRFSAEGFVRIHRGRIVNLAQVKEFRPVSRGVSVVVMRDGTQLDASYGYLKAALEAAGLRGASAPVRRANSDFAES